MFCHHCGKGLPNDAVFCNYCGSKVAPLNPNNPRPPSPGRVTVQFDANSQVQSSQYEGNQPLTPNQFGQNFPSALPPTQIGGSPHYPPFQSGSNPQLPPAQFGSNPQLPPTQFGGSLSNPQDSPLPYASNPQLPLMQFGSNPQLPPTQFGGNPQLPPAQFSSAVPPTQDQSLWQLSAPSVALPGTAPVMPVQPVSVEVPPNATQRLLVRTFGANLASNALFGIILGGLVAAVGGLASTALLLSIAHAIVPHPIGGSSYYSSQDAIDYALGIIPLHNGLRDSMQLFLLLHGVSQHVQYYSNSYSYASPLHGLLILAALFLTWGGYIAACTDYQQRVQSSLLRGVAVAIPYTLCLFLIVSQVNGCVPAYGSGQDSSVITCTLTSSSTTGLLNMDTLSLLLFGLLWGGLFGLLGASLKLGRGQWRSMLRQYLRMSPRPQVMGMIVGGLAASGLGIGLALLVVCSFIVYTSFSLTLLGRYICLPGGDWQTLTAWTLAQGPLHAMNVLFLSFGTPINFNNTTQNTCYFLGNSVHSSLSLFGTNPQLPSWTHLLLAIPIISLFFGGRVSAAIGRASGVGAGAIQGALIALPFTVLMALLSTISTITYTYSSVSSTTGNGLPMTVGASIADLILWGLLSGAVLGALGGMYQTSTIKIAVSGFLSAFLLPFVGMTRAVYLLLDQLTGQPTTLQRSRVRTLLYTAFLCTLLLAIVAAIAGAMLIMNNKFFTLDDNQHIRDIVSVALVALPGLLLLGTCASALSRDPLLDHTYRPLSADRRQ